MENVINEGIASTLPKPLPEKEVTYKFHDLATARGLAKTAARHLDLNRLMAEVFTNQKNKAYDNSQLDF